MSYHSGPSVAASGHGRATAGLAAMPEGGLSSAEAAARLARFGPNELPRARRTPQWQMLAEQWPRR
jgi:hypothetical protein